MLIDQKGICHQFRFDTCLVALYTQTDVIVTKYNQPMRVFACVADVCLTFGILCTLLLLSFTNQCVYLHVLLTFA